MRLRALAAASAAACLCAPSTRADTPPPVAPASDEQADTWPRPVGSFGVGPTSFAMIGNGVQHYGVALDFDTSVPVDGRLALDVHFTWGLTEFHRFDDLTGAGYRVGAWTTKAYEDVWTWAAIHDEWVLFRWIGAFFASVGLAFPYIAAGFCYAAAPIAPTTYLELDLAPAYELGDRSANPYFKAGLGTVAYLHPLSDRPAAGLGPTAGFGTRFHWIDVSAQLTWLPPGLHTEDPGESTHVLIGTLNVGVIP